MPPAKTTTAVAQMAPRRQGLQIENLSDLSTFAAMAFKGGILPAGCNKPEAVALLMATGMDLGMSPSQSLQCLYIVNGRVAVWGDGLLALVQRSGQLESLKETWDGAGETRRAICVVKRLNRDEHRAEFAWVDAVTAGLAKKQTYTQYPDRMLMRRARSNALRDTFADVLMGLYDGDGGEAEPVTVTVSSEATTTGVEQPTLPALAHVAAADASNPTRTGSYDSPDKTLTDGQAERIQAALPRYMEAKGIDTEEAGAVKTAWSAVLKEHGAGATKMGELSSAAATAVIDYLEGFLGERSFC